MSTQIIPVSAAGTLREHLTQYRDFVTATWKRPPNHLHYAGDLDMALREGREFRSVPWSTWRGTGYRRMTERECFRNAHLTALGHPELTYCEGFATTGLIPVHHAWCADPEGRVVDPTWREAGHDPVETWEYLGVPFDLDFVDRVTTENGVYGVLTDFGIYERPLPEGAVKKEERWATPTTGT